MPSTMNHDPEYEQIIRWLFGLQGVGMKFGLDNIRAMLEAAGNPQKSFRAVHVGGTNGKGSTSAMTAAVLAAAGFKTGLFTSPHLIDFTERIRVNGAMIPERDVIRLAKHFRAIAAQRAINVTFFEVTTAIAFEYFREHGAQWAVIEVGLGGRLDSTNVIMPEVSAITNVAFDHEAYLGDTIEKIAGEKAGIIKHGVPVITAAKGAALDVIRGMAAEAGSPIYVFGEDFRVENVTLDEAGIALDYLGLRKDCNRISSSLAGRYQAGNIAVALAVCETLISSGVSITEEHVRTGLKVNWPGRFETVAGHPAIILDAAHNPAAARALAETIAERFGTGNVIAILGVMKDKNIEEVIAPIAAVSRRVIVTSPKYARAASPTDMLSIAMRHSPSAQAAPSVGEALDAARRMAGPDGVIVVTGSFYTTGEAKELLGHTGTLTTLRE